MTSHLPNGTLPVQVITITATSGTAGPSSTPTRGTFGGTYAPGFGQGFSYPCFATCMGTTFTKGGCGDFANPDYDCTCTGNAFDKCLTSICADKMTLQMARTALQKLCGDPQLNNSTATSLPGLPPSPLPSNQIVGNSGNNNREPKLNTGLILGVIGGLMVIIIAIGALIFKYRRNQPMRQNAKFGWHRNKKYTIDSFVPTPSASYLSMESVVGLPQSPLGSPYTLTREPDLPPPSPRKFAQVGDQQLSASLSRVDRFRDSRRKMTSQQSPLNEVPRFLAIDGENGHTEDPPPTYTIYEGP